LVEVIVGELLRRMSDLDARAVDEDPDLVAVGEDLGNELRDGLLRAEVRCVDGGFAAQGFDSLLGFGYGGISLYKKKVSLLNQSSRH
jgi:hypothetical protein